MFVLQNDGFRFHQKNTQNVSPFDLALQGGGVIDAVVHLRQSASKVFKKASSLIFVVFVLFFVVLPLGYLFGFWLARKRNSLLRLMKNTHVEFETPQQYVLHKNNLDKLARLSPSLKLVSLYDVRRVPLIVRFPARKMKNISSSILTFEGWLKGRLDKYNEDQFKSEQKIFTLKSESELWRNRTKVYQYWM